MYADTETDAIVRAIQELRDEVAALRSIIEKSQPKKKRRAEQSLPLVGAPSERVADMVRVWNQTVSGRLPVAIVPKMGTPRYRAIEAALGREANLMVWKEAIEELLLSGFHTGENPRGWRATIDFIINPNQSVKWIEQAQFRSSRRQASASPAQSQACTACGAVAVVGPGTRSPDLATTPLCRECFA